MNRDPGRRAVEFVPLGWTVLLTAVIFGPLLTGTGYWLLGDMVFVPHQPWKDAWLGLDGSLARAVPMDALVSLASQVVPGWVVQRLLLIGGFVLGGVGVDRMVVRVGVLDVWARCAAISMALWNPWIHDRLAMGQWAIALGFLTVPWVVAGAHDLVEARPRALPRLALGLLAASICSPSSGVVAAVIAVVVVAGCGLKAVAGAVGCAVVANLPWLVPSLIGTGASSTGSGAFAGFAPRAESGLGVLGSLLSFGGTWKSSIVAPERTSVIIVGLALALTAVGVVGAWRLRGRTTNRLAIIAVGSLAFTLVPVLPGGARLLDRSSAALPGLALFRDAERYLAPALLLVVVGMAGAVAEVRAHRRRGRESYQLVAAALVIVPIVLLPSLAWGLGDQPRPTGYPDQWAEVAGHLDSDDVSVVLPWRGSYRGFDWNGGTAMLDPAPRYFPGQVVVDDRLFLDDSAHPAVGSEDPATARVGAALTATDPVAELSALGVDWVIVEDGMPTGIDADWLAGLPVVVDGPELTLLRVGHPHPPDAADQPVNREERRKISVLVADLLTVVFAMCMVCITSVPSFWESRSRH